MIPSQTRLVQQSANVCDYKNEQERKAFARGGGGGGERKKEKEKTVRKH